eukprot:CAMPEP_0173413086 /NCGR_PEP_ID=MMETSP1356-20130122/81100_1 /TAXON_ID=77927 ORGANISM="Hemiselmis virescens, Strain PCC157" /NCGR_SAMPLE_ID=MMETSP1356 /ASSEMBLY_ACC=CAM_ASM_000847 /LENGTH=83 /DNA_ID=CAMNT_0014375069 /DNA_START=432 /DNA_END=680 /DNA_ORIENTATION=+
MWYDGRGTLLPHAVSNLKIGSTTGAAVFLLDTAPMFCSMIRTACSPMPLLRSALKAADMCTGLSPGFSQALCGSPPSGCPTLK